ncbi:MAG TPA: hypothetical protein VN418_01105 [Gammaproteobacteria bacterium]|nr:hypothetical protein [Gammaproteobacteria bacterium]
MENLLNAEVIRAAASSSLGTLSLMCLILGIVALTFFRSAPVRAKVLVFALLLIGVAGFGYAVLNQRSPSPTPEATRQFVIGRWQVEQKIAGIEGGSFIDYLEDGSFSGRQEAFIEGRGGREQVSGSWDFTKLARDQFRMTLNYDNGNQWRGTFRILGHDRIHNIDENYVAVRVPK